MASIVFASVGGSVGNMILPGLGGRLLGSFARQAGKLVDAELGLTTSAKDGARLENFKVQDSRYGVTLPVLFGCVRVAGNVIWASDLIETAHETSVSGGKGGVMSSGLGATRTTYTYSLHCAVAIGLGPVGGVQRIWADSKVIYENGVWASGVVGSASFHLGEAAQAVDAFMESCLGSGMAPAYRGVAYIVLESLQLSKFGNRLPNLTFELLPATSTGSPTLTGSLNPALSVPVVSNRQGGMEPLVAEGGDVARRKVYVGGYLLSGGLAQFVVTTYDVTSETPVELRRDVSATFACAGVYEQSWVASPSGRYVVMGLQDTGAGYPYRTMIYDTMTHSFGAAQSTSMTALELRQMAWLDAYRVVLTDQRSGARGVRVYLRSGSSLVDQGFFDVWGSGSASTRLPLAYAQFRAYGDGLLTYAGDASLKFSNLYMRVIAWSGTGLSVGAAVTVSSGYNLGTGSSPQVHLIETGEGEWTLCYMTVSDMQMLSFVPNASGVTITRPWQKIKSAKFVLSNTNYPVLYGDRLCVLHRSYTESQYRLSEINLEAGAFTLVTDAAAVVNSSPPASNFSAYSVSATRLAVLGNSGSTATLAQAALVKRRNTGDTLARIVAAILERAGYADSDYDVSALDAIEVDGYALSDQTTAARAIEPLQNFARFDLVEQDGMLRAVLHGQGDGVSVAASETGASLALEKGEDGLVQTSRAQQLDLPLEVCVDYLDASLDYETGSQRARRSVSGGARSVEKITLPLVCSATRARRVAENQLYAAWVQRERYRLYLSLAFVGLNPSDVVVYEGKRLRVLAVTRKRGIVQVDALPAVPSDMVSEATAESPLSSSASANVAVSSEAYLMDVPLLREQDDQAGLYVAVSGVDGWRGASLWRAADGVSFTRLTSFVQAASAGVATTALGAASPFYKDKARSVRVQMLRGQLASCTESELLNGANVALLGEELIQFQTATLIEAGLYELSGLLRGRRGTEDKTGSHLVGERFVLLTATAMQFVPTPLSDRGISYHFRAVSDGGSLDFALDRTLAYGMKTLEPYAPVHIKGARSAGTGSDVTLRWKRRARMNAAWVDYIDVPLDEAQELYDVEIMNGGTVVRTFSDVAQASVVYTAAMQTTDWGASIPSTYTVRVYQKSARYGRGKRGEGEV